MFLILKFKIKQYLMKSKDHQKKEKRGVGLKGNREDC